MPLNVPLLRKTLEHIEAHPEEHNQEEWRCGTTMCFAGHAAVIDGARFVDALDDHVVGPDGGDGCFIEYYAQDALGLTDKQAEELFYDCESLREVRDYVTGLLQNERVDV